MIRQSEWAISTPPIAITRCRCAERIWCCSIPAKPKGGGDWSGSFVGTSFIFSDRANLGTLEGDPRFFFDDSQTPAGPGHRHGGMGRRRRLLGRQNMTLPFAGHPVGARRRRSSAKRRG